MRTLWPPDAFYGQTPAFEGETIQVLKRQFATILTMPPAPGGTIGGARKGHLGRARDHGDVPPLPGDRAPPPHPPRSLLGGRGGRGYRRGWFYRSTVNNLDIPTWRNRHWGIARMGAPVDTILLSDLLEGRAREYKLYLFLNTPHFAADERQRLKALLRRDGKVALWSMPGIRR